MKPNQGLMESIKELRDSEKVYPRRATTLEEFSNAKLNEIFSLVSNKISREPAYQMRDKGFLTMLDVMEKKCVELQGLLKQMNDESWEIKDT